MNDSIGQEYSADLSALKAANDELREHGKRWLFETLEQMADEINLQSGIMVNSQSDAPPNSDAILIGKQEWQFEVEKSVMVGERMGVRRRERTIVIEVGWPRLPEHGYVPDQGLARGRVSLSPNVMIDPLLIDEIILKRQREGEPIWQMIANKKLGDVITQDKLREYIQRLFIE